MAIAVFEKGEFLIWYFELLTKFGNFFQMNYAGNYYDHYNYTSLPVNPAIQNFVPYNYENEKLQKFYPQGNTFNYKLASMQMMPNGNNVLQCQNYDLRIQNNNVNRESKNYKRKDNKKNVQ